jgi:hypothetical protein
VALQLDTSSALAQHQRQHSQQRKHACAAKRKVRKAKKQKKKICGFFLVTKRSSIAGRTRFVVAKQVKGCTINFECIRYLIFRPQRKRFAGGFSSKFSSLPGP